MESQIIKTTREIERAHDVLIAVLLGDAILGHRLDEEQMCDVMAYASVFCWLLGHDHNPTFAQNMAMLEERLRRAGYVLTEGRRLQRRSVETVQ